MKDKLTKTGRKGSYYKARRFFLATLLFATLAATATVATVVSVSGGVKAKEREEVMEVASESETNLDESEALLAL